MVGKGLAEQGTSEQGPQGQGKDELRPSWGGLAQVGAERSRSPGAGVC